MFSCRFRAADGAISFVSPKEMAERKGDPKPPRNPAAKPAAKAPPNSRLATAIRSDKRRLKTLAAGFATACGYGAGVASHMRGGSAGGLAAD